MSFRFSFEDHAVDEIVRQLSIASDVSVNACFKDQSPLIVEKNGNYATITYGRRVELFRGLGLLAEYSGEESFLIQQKAAFKMNGVMLDCSRNGVAKVDTVKRLIRYMALMGLDMLMLYTEDTYEVPEYPYFGYMRGRYTAAEMQEMDRYAESYGIEMIPCIQTLGHLAATLRWQAFEGFTDNDDILLCEDERTYDLIEAMIRACRNGYKTKRIHIGMDEAFMLGLGQYRVKHGIVKREEIFCKHLERVNEICKKYNFRPMIWSDMFYRIAFGGNYSPEAEITQEVIDLVPDGVDLVYWDYYRHKAEDYNAAFESHLKFNTPVLFAGGAWRWVGYTPHTVKSLEASRAALTSCLEKGIEEVFCTAWGDGGNEAPIFCILPTLQLYAEYGYQGEVSDEVVAQRLLTCTGEHFDDMLKLDLPDMPDGKYHRIETNPSRYLLYMDVMNGMFERHTEECYKEYYTKYAAELREAAVRSKNCGYIYELLGQLCTTLAVKGCVSADMRAAYKAGDKDKLRHIADVVLPEAAKQVDLFNEAVEKRWDMEYKRSGYDVLDYRLGGVKNRTLSAIKHINRYLNGEIDRIEELEEQPLAFNCLSDEELEKDRVMCWGIWRHIVTPNVM